MIKISIVVAIIRWFNPVPAEDGDYKTKAIEPIACVAYDWNSCNKNSDKCLTCQE